MKIIPMGLYEIYGIKEVYGTTLRQILCSMRRAYGEVCIQSMSKVKIVLFSANTEIKPITLAPHSFDMDITKYDAMALVPGIEGAEPISLTAIAANIVAASGVIGAFGLSGSMALFLIDVVAFALQIGLAIGIGALIQAISPTPTTNDAKQAQKKESNLWNGNQVTTIQGSPLPMIFGTPFCDGGVVIGTSLSTEDIIIDHDRWNS